MSALAKKKTSTKTVVKAALRFSGVGPGVGTDGKLLLQADGGYLPKAVARQRALQLINILTGPNAPVHAKPLPTVSSVTSQHSPLGQEN